MKVYIVFYLRDDEEDEIIGIFDTFRLADKFAEDYDYCRENWTIKEFLVETEEE